MGKVLAVCISDRRGIQKTDVQSAEFIANHGIEGDAHAGGWHRQVSLISSDKVEAFRTRGANVDHGAFGENLVVEGIDFRALPVAERNAPGIAEAIRAASLQITPRAMLSRAVSVIRGKTLIINLSGSPKACMESMDVFLDTVPHAMGLLRSEVQDCAR